MFKKVGVPLLYALAAAGVLVAVFLLYANPLLMVQLAEQLWSCFG